MYMSNAPVRCTRMCTCVSGQPPWPSHIVSTLDDCRKRYCTIEHGSQRLLLCTNVDKNRKRDLSKHHGEKAREFVIVFALLCFAINILAATYTRFTYTFHKITWVLLTSRSIYV